MLAYTIRRMLGAVPTMLVIVTLSFFLIRLAPGGPFDPTHRLPPQIKANIEKAYHLDQPLGSQYLHYLGNLARFDFGPSYKMRAFTVSQLIEIGLPVSARIGFSAMLIATLFGTTLGTLAALYQNTRRDYAVMSVAVAGMTIPTFVTAPILTLLFGVAGITVLGHDFSLPVAGWNNGAVANLILPITVLALPQIAIIARLVRASMIDVLHSNYIRTARAKGLPPRLIIQRHALRAAILPMIAYLGPASAGLLAGSLVVEQIFGLPGIGRYFVEAALDRDYTVVMGVIIVYAAFVIMLNLFADLLIAALDPRVRYR